MKIVLLLFGFPILGFSQNTEKNNESDNVQSTIISVMTKIEPNINLIHSDILNGAEKTVRTTDTVITKMEKSFPVIPNREKQAVYKVGEVVNNTIVTTMVKGKE